MKTITLLLALLASAQVMRAQIGISTSPPRLYYTLSPGKSQTQRILVSNPSKDYALELGVSLNDWRYSPSGENLLYRAGTLPSSCASWVSIPEAFISLAPGESRHIDVQMTMPEDYHNDTVSVHTAMLFITQLNPGDGKDETGANIRIAVRSGIKLYQRLPGSATPNIEIADFAYLAAERPLLRLDFDNIGNIWVEGKISLELLNQVTGKKTVVPDVAFYSLPGDNRKLLLPLPTDLEPGSYVGIAIVNYGDTGTIKAAELTFSHG